MKLFFLLILAALLLPACKKAAPPPAAVPVTAAPVVDIPLAARLPGDAEGFVCSVNLRQHLDALFKTRAWGDMAAFWEEKRPAGASGISLDGVEDFALAAGPGSAQALSTLRQLQAHYNEWSYRAMLQLVLGSFAGGGQPWQIDPAMADSVILQLERFEVPPVMLALRGEKAADLINTLTAELQRAPWFANAPASTITTTEKERLAVTEVEVAAIWPQELRKKWLDALQVPDEALRSKISQALDVLLGKTLVIAFGNGPGVAYFGVAAKKDGIRLAEGAADSVLARPELAFLKEHAAQDLMSVAYAQSDILSAMHDVTPTLPLLKGLAAFPMLQKLTPQFDAVRVAEAALMQRDFTHGAAVLWWQGGMHAEVRGGVSGAALLPLAKASQFTPLLEGERVLFGLSGHGSGDGTARAYFEAWMSLLHAGVAQGPFAEQPWANMLPLITPGVLEAYASSKTLWQKGLGTDSALVFDLGGRMPAFPGLPAGGEKLPLPRFAAAQEVTHAALVSTAWLGMESGVTNALKPLMMPLPKAESFAQKGLTAHFHTLPFGSADWTLCASLNERVMLFGTSREQQSELAEKCAEAANVPGWHARLDFARLREFLASFEKIRSQQKEEASFKRTIQWLAPLGDLRFESRVENGQFRAKFDWSMKDVPQVN